MLPLVIVRGRLGNHMIKFIQKSEAKVFVWSQGYSVIYMMGHGWLDPNILHDGRTVSGNLFLLGLGFAARCANSTKILFVFGPRLSSTNVPPSTLCIALLE